MEGPAAPAEASQPDQAQEQRAQPEPQAQAAAKEKPERAQPEPQQEQAQPAPQDQAAQEQIEAAAALIRECDALLVCTGAGMGVDSGLGTFRGKNAGVWPPLLKRGLDFSEVSDPQWFEDDAHFAWAFWKFRHDAYTQAPPHRGYSLLREWAEGKPHGMFSFTSNIDGHWFEAGVPEDRCWEVHGTVRHLQCTDDSCCAPPEPGGEEGAAKDSARTGSWPTADALAGLREDPETNRIVGGAEVLPRCRNCGGLARPNVLMFGDWNHETTRSDAQEAAYEAWQAEITAGGPAPKVAVIEIGAGMAVPTVRMEAQHAADQWNAPLIRLNLETPQVEHLKQPGVSIAIGALEALVKIDEAMKRQPASSS